MPNHPMLHYKPGLTMDAPISVVMAAADWVAMMTWFSHIDQDGELDGVKHLVYGVISPQLANALHTAASRHAAEAHLAEHVAQHNNPMAFLQQMGIPVQTMPEPDDFKFKHYENATETWIIECSICGSRDEYEERHLGPLTCGHDAGRKVVEVKITPDASP